MRNCTYFGFAQKLKGTIKIRKAGKQEKSILYFPSFLLSSFLMFCYRSRVLGKATYFYSCFGMMITLLALVITASAQEVKDKESPKKRPPMPIYITPFYDSDGMKIDVGEFSEKLAKADAKSILNVQAEIKKQVGKVRCELMNVLAIRLYDLGHKDESIYWFHAAQYRARVFVSVLDKEKMGGIGAEAFELKQAYGSFSQLAGTYINGYAFGELKKLEVTLGKVIEEGKSVPKLAEIYPKVKFVESGTWNEKNAEVSAGMTKLIEFIKTKADYIKEQRKSNGIEGKYGPFQKICNICY